MLCVLNYINTVPIDQIRHDDKANENKNKQFLGTVRVVNFVHDEHAHVTMTKKGTVAELYTLVSFL